MRKADLDRLLETAVANALGVTPPRPANRRKTTRTVHRAIPRVAVRPEYAHAHV